MAESQVDPARLHGEELRRWYMRSPAEIEEEHQVAARCAMTATLADPVQTHRKKT